MDRSEKPGLVIVAQRRPNRQSPESYRETADRVAKARGYTGEPEIEPYEHMPEGDDYGEMKGPQGWVFRWTS